jgi:hypothetical protein
MVLFLPFAVQTCALYLIFWSVENRGVVDGRWMDHTGCFIDASRGVHVITVRRRRDDAVFWHDPVAEGGEENFEACVSVWRCV